MRVHEALASSHPGRRAVGCIARGRCVRKDRHPQLAGLDQGLEKRLELAFHLPTSHRVSGSTMTASAGTSSFTSNMGPRRACRPHCDSDARRAAGNGALVELLGYLEARRPILLTRLANGRACRRPRALAARRPRPDACPRPGAVYWARCSLSDVIDVFVKVIGEHDSHIGKTRFVEHRTRHLGKPCEITRIYADALGL